MSPVRPKDDRNYRAELALASLQAVLGVYAPAIIRLPWWGQALTVPASVAATAVLVGIVIRKRRGEGRREGHFLRSLVRLQVGALKWLLAGLPGVAVALLALGAVSIASGRSCAAPADLRILTAQENVPAVADAAARYVADRSGDGCRSAIVTVSAGSAVQDIEAGFTRGWRTAGTGSGAVTYPGPRPDVWIPDTTAAAVEARTYLSDFPGDRAERAELDVGGSVGTSPMVVAVFGAAFSPPGSTPGRLDTLLGTLRSARLDAPARPSAQTSEAALVATPVLSAAVQRVYGVGPPEAERLLSSGGPVASDAAALLCRFRALDEANARPPANAAVVVPEIALARYDADATLGTGAGCGSGRRANGDPTRFPSPRWRMYPYYADDLPLLDHPFVHVRWPGQDNAARDRLVDDFRSWITARPPRVAGLRTPQGRLPAAGADMLRDLSGLYDPTRVVPTGVGHIVGRAASLARWRDAGAVYRAGRPPVSLKLLFDVSGSMATPLGGGEPRLFRAKQIASGLLRGVRDDDKLQVAEFSDRVPLRLDPAPGDRYPPGDRDVLASRIQNTRSIGSDRSLVTAVDDAAKQAEDSGDLVVLTDGQLVSTNPRAAVRAAALRSSRPGLRVHIVLTGPKNCGDDPVRAIARAFGPHTCVDGSVRPPDDTADALLAAVLWGEGR
jgi:hypothetical protein